MTNWDAKTYDRFEAERARPSRDLIARVAALKPRRILDLGCGSGLSTLELRRAFKGAEIVGADISPDMLKAAAKRLPGVKFVAGDAADFDTSGFDLVFANAVFHWVPITSPRSRASPAPCPAAARWRCRRPTTRTSPATA